MISLDDMMVFCKVAEKSSFTHAATELGLGKARVSQIVTKLESSINTRLIHRTTRSLSLTDAGQDYYEHCLMIREIASRANSDAKSIRKEPSGVLRISIPLGTTALSALLSDFLLQYPQISLDIIESDGYQNLIETRCDIAIRASMELEDSSLYATKVGEIRDILCVSPEYLSKVGGINHPDELSKMDWISHEIVHGDNTIVLRSKNSEVIKIKQKARVLVRTAASLKQFVLNNIGFGILPSFVIQDELVNGELVQILPNHHEVHIPLYAVYVDKAYMPLKVRALLDYLKANKIA